MLCFHHYTYIPAKACKIHGFTVLSSTIVRDFKEVNNIILFNLVLPHLHANVSGRSPSINYADIY